jgi:hypothetical protein
LSEAGRLDAPAKAERADERHGLSEDGDIMNGLEGSRGVESLDKFPLA